MSASTVLRRACAVSIAVLAVPGVAHAAEAPTRFFALDASEQRVSATSAQIGTGGREVAFNAPTATPNVTRVLLRNVATNTTTEVLPAGSRLVGASDDLQRLLYATARTFDPADTNGALDLYVLDRATGSSRLATRDASGAVGEDGLQRTLSGDGRVFTYSLVSRPGSTYRVAVDTGSVTVVPGDLMLSPERVSDTTGNVTVTSAGIFVGARKVALPAGSPSTAQVSRDGSTVVFQGTDVEVVAVNTTTGVATTAAIPRWLRLAGGYNVKGVSRDGARVLFSVVLQRTAGYRLVVGALTVKTGALVQLGGDLPTDSGLSNLFDDITPAWDFIASNASVGQLGTTPIPGVAGPVPPPPSVAPYPVTRYLTTNEGCAANGAFPFQVPAQRASMSMITAPDRPYLPAKADVVVRNTATGRIVNQFTIIAINTPRQLTTGITGGWSYTAKVTFTDGTSITGGASVPVIVPVKCYNPLGGF